MMRRVKVPFVHYDRTDDGQIVRTGTSCVEVIEWTHPDGTRTFLAPFAVR